MDEQEWVLKLLDAASGNALKIASSLGNLDSKQLQAAQSAMALQKAQAALASAEQNGSIAGRAAAQRGVQSAQLQQAQRAAKERENAAKAAARAEAKAAKESAAAQKDAAAQSQDAMSAMQHPIDAATGALAKMGPEGMAAAAAIVVLTAAVTATVGALTAMAVAAIGVVQTLGLMTARFAALAGSVSGGAAVTAMVEKLGAKLPFATEQIAGWAAVLQRAGLAGKDLEAATRAVAAAAAINPEGGAAAATSAIEKLVGGGKEATEFLKSVQEGSKRGANALREMGLRVEDLGGKAAVAKMSADELAKSIEKALVKKGAGPLGEMAATWPAIVQKAREGLLSLFNQLGPAVRPFMAAVKSLFGEFSKGGDVINALKPAVTSVMSTLFSWGTKVVTAIHAIVSGLTNATKSGGLFSGVIGAMRGGWLVLTTIFKAVAAALTPIWANLKIIFTNAMFLKGLKTIFTLIAGAVLVVVTVIGAIVGAWAIFVGFIAGTVGTIVGVATMVFGSIADLVGQAIDALGGLPSGAMDAASGFISGLVGGISAGIGGVVDAVGQLASAALAGFTGPLGIHSPSTVLWEHGEDNMAGAVAGGVDAGAPKVDKSMGRLGEGRPGKGKGGEKGKLAETIVFQYGGPAEDAPSFFEQAHAWLEQLRAEAAT